MTQNALSLSRRPAAAPRPLGAGGSTLRRTGVLLYGAAVYGLFLATFLYMVGFVAGAVVPKHVDSAATSGLTTSLLINAALLGLFGVQHAIMARPAFKRRWTKIIPPAAERSTFVLATCIVLGLMVWQWRPLPDVVWSVEGWGAYALWVVSGLGWLTVLLSTFLIDHFELFGLRQSVQQFLGRPIVGPEFRERLIYRVVRHPLMLGFMIAFWATPVMTVGHLVFAGLCTAYIFVGLQLEEADLIKAHGEAYLDYKRRVPGLIPRLGRAAR